MSDDRELTEEEKEYKERMMRAFWRMVKMGILVPKLDAQGQPVIREGEVAYTYTTDPKIRLKYPELFVHNN